MAKASIAKLDGGHVLICHPLDLPLNKCGMFSCHPLFKCFQSDVYMHMCIRIDTYLQTCAWTKTYVKKYTYRSTCMHTAYWHPLMHSHPFWHTCMHTHTHASLLAYMRAYSHPRPHTDIQHACIRQHMRTFKLLYSYIFVLFCRTVTPCFTLRLLLSLRR